MSNATSPTPLEWDGKILPSMAVVQPSPGSSIECQHCSTPAFAVIDDCLVVIHRHHGQYHKTIVSLRELGYVRVA